MLLLFARVAVDAHLWGPALLLAKLSGGSAFDETAGAMTSSYLRPGTPLQTLLSAASAQPAVQQQQQQGGTNRLTLTRSGMITSFGFSVKGRGGGQTFDYSGTLEAALED